MAGVQNSGNKGQNTEPSYLRRAERRSIQHSAGTKHDTTLAAYVCAQGKEGKVL